MNKTTILATLAILSSWATLDTLAAAQQATPEQRPTEQTPNRDGTPEGRAPTDSAPNSSAASKALAAQARLDSLIKLMDSEATRNGASWQFTVAQQQLFVVTDAEADRMRIMSPIAPAANLSAALLKRMLQANYDAALDARYAIAQNIVWSVFIHPLTSLKETDFLSGAAQTVVAAQTFGTSFTSGAFVYGGGDSNGIHQQLLEDLKKKTEQRM